MNDKPSALQSWILAARPKTLTCALAPVMIALAATWNDTRTINVLPALLCTLFAIFMQIDANFINDYYDCLKGVDHEDRLGPERACSQGWISLPSMRRGILITTVLSALVGLPLLFYTDMYCILIGAACILTAEVPCAPCFRRVCPRGDNRCMAAVEAAEVVRELETLPAR